MSYEKRLCVLKQIKKGFSADGRSLSGSVHAERLGDTLTLTLRLLDVAPVKEGRYALAVKIGKSCYLFDLDKTDGLKIENCPSLQNGFSALVVFMRAEVEPVCFGCCGGESEDYSPLLRALQREGEGRRGATAKPKPPVAPLVQKYEDEAIAEDDYFKEKKDADEYYENEDAPRCDQATQAKKACGAGDGSHDEDEGVRPLLKGGNLAYYCEMRDKIDAAFKKYPRVAAFEGVFEQSEWVDAGGALFGIVYEGGKPKYLCLATDDVREQTANDVCFVPNTPFAEEGKYVLFQSADTGELVRVQKG